MGFEDQITDAVTRLEAAVFSPSAWDAGLQALARATGSRAGQLIGLGGPDGTVFNHLPDLDPDFLGDWVEAGLDRAAVNSRIRVGSTAPVMAILDEADFTTEADMLRTPLYGDLIERSDTRFTCATNLVRRPDVHIGLAVLRGRTQGNIEPEQKRAFARLAVHARQSARIQLMTGLTSAQATGRGLDAIGLAALVCDGAGRVMAVNDAAEALLVDDDRLILVGGRLVERSGGRDLSAQARAVALGRVAALEPVLVPADDAPPLVVEFTALPSDTPGFPGAPGALIVVRRVWSAGDAAARLGARLHGYTARETEVAAGLCRGLSPTQISQALGMRLGTVRTHIRRLLDKSDAGSLGQLIASLRAYDA